VRSGRDVRAAPLKNPRWTSSERVEPPERGLRRARSHRGRFQPRGRGAFTPLCDPSGVESDRLLSEAIDNPALRTELAAAI
jgi:hypothetical protein